MTKKTNNKKNGFTLVEMLVSVAIFSIALMVIIGAIISIVDTNRKAQTLSSVMTNLNFALETMTRDIKTSNAISVGSSNESVSMVNQENQNITYSFVDNVLKKNGQPLTSIADVVIEKASFSLIDNNFYTENAQPMVFVLIKGYAKITEKIRSDFSIQSSISQRDLDLAD